MSWNPDQDGVTHINIYSKAKTPLGRALTNFSPIGFIHPDHGPFKSIEGYWYWLSTKDDALRNLHGYKAKEYGRSIRGEDWPTDDAFETNIKKALTYRMFQNPSLMKDFLESTLPFTHYYVYHGKTIEPKQGLWMIQFLIELRDVLNQYGIEQLKLG